MECFRYASGVFPDFRWFVTIASNSLFFRNFDENAALYDLDSKKAEPANVKWDALPMDWHWPSLHGFEAAGQHLQTEWMIDGLWRRQIEGQLATRLDWELVFKVHHDLTRYWDGLQAPLEEILPATVINSIGSGKSANICRVKWTATDAERNATLAEMSDLKNFPPQICMMKWFRRSPSAVETLIVGTSLGQALLKAVQDDLPDSEEELHTETLINIFLTHLKERHRWTPLEFEQKATNSESCYHLKILIDKPVFCSLDGAATDYREPYLYLECADLEATININFLSPGQLMVKCQVNSPSPQVEVEADVLGILFLPVPKARLMRLITEANDVIKAQFLEGVSWRDDTYTLLPHARAVMTEMGLIIDYILPFHVSQGFIGLPLHAGQEFDLKISYV